MDGLVLANRILGFVNAPAIGQQVLEHCLGSQVDLGVYERRRRLLRQVLEAAGYEFEPPKGGFYFFPKAPGGDDVAFVNRLQQERVLAVPGSGFGYGGYFRMSFCVPDRVIENSADSLARAAAAVSEPG
jgi:aspartate aminotransferase